MLRNGVTDWQGKQILKASTKQKASSQMEGAHLLHPPPPPRSFSAVPTPSWPLPLTAVNQLGRPFRNLTGPKGSHLRVVIGRFQFILFVSSPQSS